MSDNFALVIGIAATWLAIGVVLSTVMGRRGHNGYQWLVLGTLLGPFAVVLAVDAWRHDERLGTSVLNGPSPAVVGTGPVDVLVGYDGSPESLAAIEAATELLGDRLGRLSVATVVSYSGIREEERLAAERLRRLAVRYPGATPELDVLHGHPSTALLQWAVEGGFGLVAVGTRGHGITKAILGSAASELARDSKIPVLLVGPGR